MSAGHERRAAPGRPRRGCCGRTTRTRGSCGSTGASGFDQESRRWKIGYRRNIPPGESSPRDDRVLDAEPREAVARLQSARAASDDDDRVVARREVVYSSHSRTEASRRRMVCTIRTVTCGYASRNGSTSSRGMTRQRSGERGDDVGRGRVAGQGRDVAEEVAAPEARDLLVADARRSPRRRGRRRARCRPGPCGARAGPRRRILLVGVRDPLELRAGEIGEERKPGEVLGVGSGRHARNLPLRPPSGRDSDRHNPDFVLHHSRALNRLFKGFGRRRTVRFGRLVMQHKREFVTP